MSSSARTTSTRSARSKRSISKKQSRSTPRTRTAVRRRSHSDATPLNRPKHSPFMAARAAAKLMALKKRRNRRTLLQNIKAVNTILRNNIAKNNSKKKKPRRMSFEWDPTEFNTDLKCNKSWSTHELPGLSDPQSSANEEPAVVLQIQVQPITPSPTASASPAAPAAPAIALPAIRIPRQNSVSVLPQADVPQPLKAVASPSPRRLLRKRPSSTREIPEDLRSPTTEGEKRFKYDTPNADERKVQSGDRVEIVRAAKKKFLGRCGVVEKYLRKKQKWGIVLDGGNRIALGGEALKILEEQAPTIMRTHSVKGNPHGDAAPEPAQPKPADSKQPSAARVALGKRIKVKRTKRAQKNWGLVKQKINPTKLSDIVSQVAATRDQVSEFRKSFDAECRPRNAHQTMLAACVTGRPDIIKALVFQNNVCIHMDNGAQQSLLHVAIENDQPACALLLLEMGIETNAMDAQDRSPLLLAAEHGMAEVATSLCQSGARMNQRDRAGRTALMVAAVAGHLKVVSTLLTHGADPAAEDAEGKTALALTMAHKTQVHEQIGEQIMEKLQEPEMNRVRDERLKQARRTEIKLTRMEQAKKTGRKTGRKVLSK